MFLYKIMIICMTIAAHGEALIFSRRGQYIPNIKVAEEIDISDVTFTTPAPDSDHVASLINPRVNKPRIIVPVVTYHKVTHPAPAFFGPPSDSTVNYEKRNYGTVDFRKKPRKYKYIPLNKGLGDFFVAGQSSGGGSKTYYQLPGKFRQYTTPKPLRPVYYLVGDEPANPTYDEGDYNGNVITSSKYPENVGLFNEQELKFSKPKNYPKKFLSPSVNEYNHRLKPDGPEESDASPYDDENHKSESSDSNEHSVRHSSDMPSANGDRVEFQMYGMNGPNSYKFGYDTGKGDNRHFRFEERDNDGKIRGHYGYLDNEGKMRIMKYEADPETGFHAGPVDFSDEDSN